MGKKMDKKRIAIGKVGKAHGIKGEIKVIPLTDDLERFRELSYVLIDDEEYKVEGVKLQAERAILKLDKFNSPEETMAIRNKIIDVWIKDAVKKKKGEFFVNEIEGLRVFDSLGSELGEIVEVLRTGSNDVYLVKGPKEILIPAIKSVVMEINLDENKMIIAPLKEWHYED